MLTRTRTPALGLVATLGLVLGVPTSAYAAPVECGPAGLDGSRECGVTAQDPGSGGPTTVPAGTSSDKTVTCEFFGEPIDCTSDVGTWSNARKCWVSVLDPQPPAEDPLWEGRTDGAIYRCWPPGTGVGGGIGGINFFWAAAPPPQVNPAQLARQAVDSMNLHAPRVGATPLPSAEAVSVIGLPTWLWIDDADSHSWGPITRTASTGGVTVTATARVAKVVWDMGDGHTVTCTGKGTVWTAAKGSGDSPTCGYRYTRPGRRTITATTFWEVDWSGAGQTGTITFDLSGTRTVNVVELRAVNT